MLNDGRRGEHPGSWSAWVAGARVRAWAGSRDVRGQGKKEKKEERRREKEKEEREKRKKEKKKKRRRWDSWSTRNRAHAKRGEQEN